MRKKKVLCAVLSLAIATGLTGCAVGNVEVVWSLPVSNNTVFRIEGRECSLGTMKMVLANYKNLYVQTYGEDLWNQEGIREGLEEHIKKVTLSQLAKMDTICLLAEEQGISLTEEEIQTVQAAAKAYEETLSKKEIHELGISYNDIKDFYMEYALATKLYTKLTGGIDEEVSDDDARVMEVLQIVVTDSETAQVVQDKLASGSDFQALASYYSTLSETDTFLYWQDIKEEQKAALCLLNDGEISETVAIDNTYYIYKCVSKINRELTEENKKTIVKDRATQAFDNVYEEYKLSLSSTYNADLWEELKLDFSDEVVTSSLFSVFDTYCGYLKRE